MDFKLPKYKKELESSIHALTINMRAFLLRMASTNQHKAALLFYWLTSYIKYIKAEETFNPKYLPEMKAGQLIKADFGFGIGSEFGGLHYAVILVDSPNKSSTVTVCPLRSLKREKGEPKSLFYTDVHLNTNLFTLLDAKLKKILCDIENDLSTLRKIDTAINNKPDVDKINEFFKHKEKTEKHLKHIHAISNEINRLSSGTVAITNQIRTISKQRILNPIRKDDVLHDVRFKKSTTDQIRKTIKMMYNL